MWLGFRKRVGIRKTSVGRNLKVDFAEVKRKRMSGEQEYHYTGKKKSLT